MTDLLITSQAYTLASAKTCAKCSEHVPVFRDTAADLYEILMPLSINCQEPRKFVLVIRYKRNELFYSPQLLRLIPKIPNGRL